jgi:hypothetical protein
VIILLPILLYLTGTILLVGLHFWRPAKGIAWLIAAITALLVWGGGLFSRSRIPDSLNLGTVTSPFNFSFQITFTLDKVSWPLSWAVAALIFAWVYISITNLTSEPVAYFNWWAWPAGLSLGALGIAGVLSGNLYTMIFTWAAADLFFLAIFLFRDPFSKEMLYSFGLRMLGLFITIGAIFFKPGGLPLNFPLVNVTVNTIVLIGALTRLISLGISPRLARRVDQSKEIIFVTDLVLIATCLSVITRTGTFGISQNLAPTITKLAGIAAVLGSFLFAIMVNHPARKIYLYLCLIAFAISAVLVQGAEASMAWCLVAILPASLLFLHQKSIRDFNILFILSAIGFTALPFTPAWHGIWIFPDFAAIPGQGTGWVAYLIAQSLMITGIILTIIQPRQPIDEAERWSRIVYVIGLSFLPLTQFLILLIGQPGLLNDFQGFPELTYFWINIPAILLSVLLAFLIFRYRNITMALDQTINRITPFVWMNGLFTQILALGQRSVHFIDQILEGEGGIIWTILFLLLLLAFIVQLGSGG